MPLFRRNPTKHGPGRWLVALHENNEREMLVPLTGPGEYYTVGVRCASAGAVVALGGFLSYLSQGWSKKPAEVAGMEDPIARFAHAVGQSEPVEKCYRVVVWAYLTDWVN